MKVHSFYKHFYESFSSLMGTKQRSLLGLLGIIIGIASVIMLVNIASIVKYQIMQQFKSMGTDVFVVNVDLPKETSPAFNLQSINQLKNDFPDVTCLAPFESIEVPVDFSTKTEYDYFSVIACTKELFDILKIKVLAGRPLSDLDTYETFTVVGNNFSKKKQLYLNDVIRLQHTGFSIIGINKSVDDNYLVSFGPNDTVFISLKNAKTLTKNFRISSLIGKVRNDSLIDTVTSRIKNRLQITFPKQNVSIRTAKMIISQAEKQANLLSILLIAIGSIALIVGGIGIMNVMLVSVAQRKNEIGLRMALGATGGEIKLLFLSEAITLCFWGGIIGTFLGIGSSFIFAYVMDMPFIVNLFAIPIGIVISLLSGICSGVLPASQASKLNPIDALRKE